MEIQVLNHASIKIEDGKTIYIDPYDIKEEFHDADYIFITHDHYDHYDPNSISKIQKENTQIIVPKCLEEEKNDLVVEPNKEYTVNDLFFQTIPSYNIGKPFHPKEKEYVGYLIKLKGVRYYAMGDTDRTEEADSVQTDVCFVPIGGTYTMNVEEATAYINETSPKLAIPIHYGKIVGDLSLGKEFQSKINKNIKTMILIKENEQ